MKIGIDIGGSHIAIGLVNELGEIELKKEKDIKLIEINNNEIAQDNIIKIIVSTVREILEEKQILLKNVELIGVSFPGDVTSNCITKAENLGIENFNIVDKLHEKLDTQVILRNDAKCAALAEKKYGSLINYDDAVFMILGTGIGGAAFLGGNLLVPKRHPGFEFGHTIIEKEGTPCNCGANGCFEMYGSMRIFKKEIAQRLNVRGLNGKELKEYIESNIGNDIIKNIINEYIENLTIGIANLINIFEPEIVSIGGSFTYYEDILLDKLTKSLQNSNVIYNPEELPKIVIAKLGNDAGIIGATIL